MNLIVESLLMVDVKRKEAKKIVFSNNKNFITSQSNHLGKSLIMKSIYYALGAEVFYPSTINTKSWIVSLDFHIDTEKYKVVRYGRYFVLFHNGDFQEKYTSVTEFGVRLSEIFDFDIELVGKGDGEENREIIQCPPVFFFLPYYVDQENGWSGNSQSFNNLNQFDKSQRNETYFFHFGVYNRDYVLTIKNNRYAIKRIGELKEENKRLKTVIDTLSEGIDTFHYSFDESTLEISIENRKEELKKLLEDIEKTRNQIILEEDYRIKCQQEKEIISKYLKNNKPKETEYYDSNVECPRCGYYFTSSIAEKVKNEYLKESINNDLLELIDNVNKCEKRIAKNEHKFKSYQIRLNELENSLAESQEVYESYLKSKVTSKMLAEYNEETANNLLEINNLSEKKKEYSKRLHQYKEKRDKASNDYEEYFYDISNKLDVPKEHISKKVEPGTSIQVSGAYGPRCKISQVLAFIETQSKYQPSIISFPIVIDSPNSVEQDKNHIKSLIQTLLKWDVTSNQIIVSSIEGIDLAKEITGVNIIELDNEPNHLLNENEYKTFEKEIGMILARFV